MVEKVLGIRYKAVLLPAILWQSVAMGGAFVTGRELVEYHAKFGTLGVVSMTSYLIFTTLAGIIIFELARLHSLYDYKSFIKNLVGRFWPVIEILYIIIAVLFMSSFLSAGGIVLSDFINTSTLVASAGFAISIGVILYFGRHVIEAVASVGTVLVYCVYIIMTIAILTQRWDDAINTFTTVSTSYYSNTNVLSAASSGLLFAGYSLIIFFPVLFTTDRLESRKESVLAGVFTGVLSIIPIILTYMSLISFYPSEDVLGAPIPWFAMLQQSTGPLLLYAFVFVAFLTFIETGVGYIHSITDRIDENIDSIDYSVFTKIDTLSARQRGLSGLVVIFSSYLLSTFGIIAIVSSGYTIMAYLFLLTFAVPLFTIGLFQAFRPDWNKKIKDQLDYIR